MIIKFHISVAHWYKILLSVWPTLIIRFTCNKTKITNGRSAVKQFFLPLLCCRSFYVHLLHGLFFWAIICKTFRPMLSDRPLEKKCGFADMRIFKCVKCKCGRNIISCRKTLHFIEIFLVGIALLLSIYIYKGELNSAISSTAAHRIVARLYTWTRYFLSMKMFKVWCRLRLSN